MPETVKTRRRAHRLATGTVRRDHYVPQFIIARFRDSSLGKVYFAKKGNTAVRLTPIKDIFFQDHGERILAEPPKLKQWGETAILAGEPEWTEVAAEAIKKLEDQWARAIKGMIRWTTDLDIRRDSFVNVRCGPPRQDDWVQTMADYCLRTMFRSEEVGHELWRRRREGEERDLREHIKKELGIYLRPSDQLQEVYRQHNRARARTGALTDDIFRKRNPEFTIAIWRIVDNSRFIIGSRGGCWVESEDLRALLFPVDPKIAISLVGRKQVNSIFGSGLQLGDPRTVVHCDIPGKTGITTRQVNDAMWSSCNAVAGFARKDIEEAIRD